MSRPAAARSTLALMTRDRLALVGAFILALIVIAAIFAPWIAPYDPLKQNILLRLHPPSAEHWLGTDSYGRDVLSRIIHGARISLIVGLSAIAIAMVVGSAIGIASGYIGGPFDRVMMSFMDVILSFPTLLLGLIIAAMLGGSMQNLIIAIAITEIAPFARVARAPTIALKHREFVEAGKAMGFSRARLMWRHIVPNISPDIIVVSSLWMASAIRTEASLSFIGLGVPPPAPTWGGLIRDGFENILDSWWLIVFPSLAILLVVFALNVLGDALRDATDPKTRGLR